MSQPQHMIALAKANKIRFARSALKRELREGQITLSDVLNDERAQSMPVFTLLCSQRGYREIKARKALRSAANLLGQVASIPEMKHVGSLTDRQKRALLQACGRESERSGVA